MPEDEEKKDATPERERKIEQAPDVLEELDAQVREYMEAMETFEKAAEFDFEAEKSPAIRAEVADEIKEMQQVANEATELKRALVQKVATIMGRPVSEIFSSGEKKKKN